MKKAIAGVMITLMLSTAAQASFLDIDWSWKYIKSPILGIATDAGLVVATSLITKNNVSRSTFDHYKGSVGLIVGGIFIRRTIGQIYRLQKLGTKQKVEDKGSSKGSNQSTDEKNCNAADRERELILDEFFSKCEECKENPDKADLKELRKLCDACKKVEEKFHKDSAIHIKGKILKRIENKPARAICEALIKDWELYGKACVFHIETNYEAVKAKIEYLKNNTIDNKRKYEQVKERLKKADEVEKTLYEKVEKSTQKLNNMKWRGEEEQQETIATNDNGTVNVGNSNDENAALQYIEDNFFFKYRKCRKNPEIPLEELRKARDAYKKVYTPVLKIGALVFEDLFRDIKRTHYKHITKKQQKDLETAYKTLMDDWRAFNKYVDPTINAMYELVKVEREYLRNKTEDAKRKYEQTEKHLDKMRDENKALRKKFETSIELYLEKVKEVSEGDDILEIGMIIEDVKKMMEMGEVENK